jgi:nucleoside-diphosphate-sugar epimerase
MSKILITGANGFIGSHVVEYLISDGVDPRDIRLFIKENESLKNLPKIKFDIVRGDIRNIHDVKKATKNIDIVYHLAALIVRPEYTKKDYFDVNVEGTRNLLNAINKKTFKKFIFFSSVAIYGLPICIGDMKNFSEKSIKNPCEVYGESKLAAENLVISSKLSYAIIRPTSVYGLRDHSSFPTLIKSIKNHYFFIVGDGENKIDYVYVKDLVRGARLAEISKRKTGDYIIGGGAKSLNQISKEICIAINSWILPMHIPKKNAVLISNITHFFGLPFYPGRVNAMTSNFYFDLSKAKKEIGYEPKYKFSDGVRDLVQE